ncbi:DUF4198 domain-containing protein [Pseudomarimonas arenosa]|uniref:DUF4198 domain-containing protein n=1 Tax=Pseudomarimonas arenosa TaxID=2774145 RepID=A0AAW3ZJM1_9GAMM|nr:DUF4198 domain-containing protein [Pseudomarimonas arenosa]MBD8525650.1 DUF4198 domain-containing protein [Pseudomarimonas arenosa]
MKLRATLGLSAGLLLAASTASAHKLWMLPSATVATQGQWVTVDAAVSNDLFYFNHRPLALDGLQITAPDGSKLSPQSVHTGHFRSVFDLPLEQKGSYRLALVMDGLLASWEAGGESKRMRGSQAEIEAAVPKDAKNLRITHSTSRVETFVTAGAPDTKALQPTGHGIELKPVTHPNDLYAGETASFVLLIDGQPAANQPLTLTPGATRYRNSQDEQKLNTNDWGEFSITWPAPGMYWLNTSVEQDKNVSPPATMRRLGYAATLEVLAP